MLLGKKRKLGRKIEDMSIGEKLVITEKIEDKDLLLYLGLTNDANPLYIQHDYAMNTNFEKPIVPSIMLTGIVTSAVSKYLPGPGSHVIEQHLKFPNAAYHYATLDFLFEVASIDPEANVAIIKVQAKSEQGERVIEGTLHVTPPKVSHRMTEQAMENF